MPRIDAGSGPTATEICWDLGFPRGYHEVFEEAEQVGKGGFGVVKRVIKRASRQEFACKTLAKTLNAPNVAASQQQRHLDTIKREVAVLKTLRGTLNVVNLDSVYEDDAFVYIVMEICKGGEMWHFCGLKSYSEETVARIMRAALRTLAQCHSKGILHRDVKPGNFMFLTTDDVSPIKAVDFGLAVFFKENELPRSDLGFDGTPWFMAPEVLSSAVVPASDVWSAGVMAHQLLTGHLPFDDRKNKKAPALSLVWKSILTEEVNFQKSYWMGVSKDAKDFISTLLIKEPSKRPSAREALRHPWVRKGGSNATAKQLSSTIIQRIQRYGQSSMFKRTVLDMIANELVQSEMERGSETGDMPSTSPVYPGHEIPSRSWSSNSLHRQGRSFPTHQWNWGQSTEFGSHPSVSPLNSPGFMPLLGGMKDKKRHFSYQDLTLLSEYTPEEWEEQRKAVRLALDTSVHGAEQYMDLNKSDLKSQAGSVDHEIPESPPATPLGVRVDAASGLTTGSAAFENILLRGEGAAAAEPGLNEESAESTRRGQSLFKSYMEGRKEEGTPNGDGTHQLQAKDFDPVSFPIDIGPQHNLRSSNRSERGIPILGSQKNHLKQEKGVLKMLSSHGDHEEIKNVLESMNLMDTGSSSKTELMDGLKKLGYSIEEHELVVLLESMAPSNKGNVNLSQFLASQLDWQLLQKSHHEQWLKGVQQAFECIDMDGDGRISSMDLVQAIGEKLPTEYVESCFEQAKLEACAEERDMDFDAFVNLVRVDSNDSLPSLDQYDSRQGMLLYAKSLETVDEV